MLQLAPTEENEAALVDKEADETIDDFVLGPKVNQVEKRSKVPAKADDVIFFKYKRLSKLEELQTKEPQTNQDETTREVAAALAKEEVRQGADQHKPMHKTLVKQLQPVYDAIAPMYLGTYPLPPSKVQRPPSEVANKDLHEEKLQEIYEHWLLKLAAYPAKDGLVCVFNVTISSLSKQLQQQISQFACGRQKKLLSYETRSRTYMHQQFLFKFKFFL
jgi:hypothetical protein